MVTLSPLLRSPHLIKIWKKTGRKFNDEINVANQAISTDQNGGECVRIRSIWETRGDHLMCFSSSNANEKSGIGNIIQNILSQRKRFIHSNNNHSALKVGK